MTTYILKSSLSLLILFGLYWLILRNGKLLMFNRFFLIFSVIFSLLTPFVSITVKTVTDNPGTELLTAVNSISETIISESISPATEHRTTFSPQPAYTGPAERPVPLSTILIIIYFSGALIFSIRFIRNLLFIRRQVARAEKSVFPGYTLALTDEQINPYSFFRSIVVNKNDYNGKKISSRLIDHELEHIRQSHSYDIVLIELIRIIYWFNPLLLLYISAIRINHEYLADSGAVNESTDIRSYAETLIGYICYQKNVKLTSGFNPSATRKRLVMMARPEPGKTGSAIRIVFTMGTFMVVLLLLSCVASDYGKSGTVKDIDGNIYNTVTLGKQVWMAENLTTTRYNDGEMIPMVTDSDLWQDYKPAFCWYNNDEAAFKDKYGALYNWYAVSSEKLCPAGWHVPDMIEFWMILPDYLENNGYGLGASGREIAKSLASVSGWRADTILYNIGTDPESNNSSGFSAIPTGIRTYNGEYGDNGDNATWWSTSDYNEYVGKAFSLMNYYGRIQPWWPSKRAGFPVRCIKDVSNPRDYADFTGEWEIDLQKSSQSLNSMAQTLSIIHEGDRITLQRRMPTNTLGFDDGKYIFNLNGNEITDRIDSTFIIRSAKWSPGKQSFKIKENWISAYKGKKIETSTDHIYFMLDNGKSLGVYSVTSFTGGRYVPPEDNERITYYDRR